jgi:nicotinate phosphoribosyltransferase
VVTNDLNENTITALRGTPVDTFGVGTALVTGGGYPAAGLVYKLVEHVNDSGDWVSVAKRSPEKSNPAGRKFPFRTFADGRASEERVYVGSEPTNDGSSRDLDVVYIDSGVPVESFRGERAVRDAREHHVRARAELAVDALRLSPGDPAIPTVFP